MIPLIKAIAMRTAKKKIKRKVKNFKTSHIDNEIYKKMAFVRLKELMLSLEKGKKLSRAEIYKSINQLKALKFYPYEKGAKAQLLKDLYSVYHRLPNHGKRMVKISPETLEKYKNGTLGEIQATSLGKVEKGTKRDVYDIVNEEIIKILESDEKPRWRKGWKLKRANYSGSIFPYNFVSGKAYRGINRFMLLFLYDDPTPIYMTAKQIKEKGGNIMKGSKSRIVTFFNVVYKYQGKNITKERYMELLEKLGKDNKDLVSFSNLKYYRVFNSSAIEGIEFPTFETIEEPTPKETIRNAELILENMEEKPIIKEQYGDKASFRYSFTNLVNYIVIPKREQFENLAEFYGTLFHEIIHWTGHRTRLGRDMTGEFGSPKYAFEELVAEIGASYLNAEAGILFQNINNSASYIDGWKKGVVAALKEDKKFFFKASTKSQDAADLVLNVDENGTPAFYSKIKTSEGSNTQHIEDLIQQAKELKLLSRLKRIK